MNEDEAPESPFEAFLKNMLGEDGAAQALNALHSQGFDLEHLPAQLSDPSALNAAFAQFQYLMNTSSGPVDWRLVTDSAHQMVYSAGDPYLSAAQAERAKNAMTVADLWLDAATGFAPGPVQRQAWTRSEWIDVTVDQWKRICEPVAANVSRALGAALSEQFTREGIEEDVLPEGMAKMLGRTRELIPKLSSMMFAAQIGRALSALAQEALGTTDAGIPLVEGLQSGLVVTNVEAFGDGLDIPFDEILHFVAVREGAHRRLFNAVPWLAGDLIRAVERYAGEIEIDAQGIGEAARSLDLSDPSSLENAMSGSIFSLSVSDSQRRALDRLETILALIEGWVEVVTARTLAPYLPHVDQLQEMMRRRRAAGGPAEQVLGELIGLKMRPRRARAAAKVFSLVEADGGIEARDALWSHPDMVPTMAELDSPDTFLTMRRAALEQDADIDAALDSLLDGTMGWAQGLSPDIDPEAQTLARAGFGPTLGDTPSEERPAQSSETHATHPDNAIAKDPSEITAEDSGDVSAEDPGDPDGPENTSNPHS